ncbi:hypothetical protein ABHI18_003213 [Aspergillus niger]
MECSSILSNYVFWYPAPFLFGCIEGPRYLRKTYGTEQAARALGRLRRLPSDSPSITDELQVIQKQVAVDKAKERRWPLLEPWKLLFGQAVDRSRLLFLISAQLLSQWSGTNAITNRRKRSFMAGIILQLLALLYVAISLIVTSSLGSDAHSEDVRRAAIAAIASIYVTEMLPSSVRTLGTSILMCIHYANRFALTKAVPTMTLADALQSKGTFWFFFVVAFLGYLWGMFLLPETSEMIR